MSIKLDIGICAYNEASRIADLIMDLSGQDIFADPAIDLRVLILANGCSDDTVGVARAAIAALPEDHAAAFVVEDFAQGGKSRTVHRFIHTESRDEADILGFMDADIRLPRSDTLTRMARQLADRPELAAFSSRPVKDVDHDNLPVGPVGKIIAAGGGGLTDFRKSICGQLYMMRSVTARRIGLPVGLPVEDGFIRAMVLTDLLSAPEMLDRLDGDPEIFHVYASIRGLGELIHHQTRIVVGSAVNAALFAVIRRDAPTEAQAHDLLMQVAGEEDWLLTTLRAELPRAPFGFVPFEFLVKRLRRARGQRKSLRDRVVLALGFGLDLLVYLMASLRMIRSRGAGHW